MDNASNTGHTVTRTAPCGCTFTGRFWSARECTEIDAGQVTGRQRNQHLAAAERKLDRPVRRAG